MLLFFLSLVLNKSFFNNKFANYFVCEKKILRVRFVYNFINNFVIFNSFVIEHLMQF